MNSLKLCFQICQHNFPLGLQYITENIQKDGIIKFSVLHTFCFAVVQLSSLTKLQIAGVLDFNHGYMWILGSYILSFQITKKCSKING